MADDDLTDLDPPEERVPVIVAVHNGVITNGQPMFVQHAYQVPISVLGAIQATLADYQVGWSV